MPFGTNFSVATFLTDGDASTEQIIFGLANPGSSGVRVKVTSLEVSLLAPAATPQPIAVAKVFRASVTQPGGTALDPQPLGPAASAADATAKGATTADSAALTPIGPVVVVGNALNAAPIAAVDDSGSPPGIQELVPETDGYNGRGIILEEGEGLIVVISAPGNVLATSMSKCTAGWTEIDLG